MEPIRPSEPHIEYQVPIREWAESERPREKLITRGSAVLTDAELIALIFGNGTRTREGSLSAVQLAQALLRAYKNLSGLASRERQELERVVGIGPAKAVKLLAAFEIGRRIEAQRGEVTRVQITGPSKIHTMYGPRLRDLKREVFIVVYLNMANVIIGDHTISEGGLASSIVEPRAVFQRAILENAAAVICIHNHPSGNPEPSRSDIAVTRQIVEAGKVMGIPLHDHIIIAGDEYTSLAERGLV